MQIWNFAIFFIFMAHHLQTNKVQFSYNFFCLLRSFLRFLRFLDSFFRLLEEREDVFSLKLHYVHDELVAAGVASECLVQLAYAIGVAEPVSVYVNSYGTGVCSDAEIAVRLRELFDLRPAAIVRRFGLKNPIYAPTAAYGHFGREPYVKDGIQFFGWEKLDAVDLLRSAFELEA